MWATFFRRQKFQCISGEEGPKVSLSNTSFLGQQKFFWATKVSLGNKSFLGQQKFPWATKVSWGKWSRVCLCDKQHLWEGRPGGACLASTLAFLSSLECTRHHRHHRHHRRHNCHHCHHRHHCNHHLYLFSTFLC